VRVAGLNPEMIEYLQKAGEFLGNLEEIRIEQIGEVLSQIHRPFELIESFRHLKR
jgi:hypothetical protein